MGSLDRADDRTFKVNFSGEGAAKLKDAVKEKLKEFMGDYTDDVLVDYVVVLLRNGRRREEARNELNVFLGDDSDSFVSWLWDHLASSLDLYVQAEDPEVAKGTKTDPLLEERYEINDSQNMGNYEGGEKPSKLLRSRHNREWRGLVKDAAEPPPLLSSEVQVLNVDKKHYHRVGHVKRSVSPRRPMQKKRGRAEERNKMKRELLSQAIDAPRRLLQFAVRDAVATARPDSATGSSLKRLRSVVSTSVSSDPLMPHMDRPSRIHSVARMPNAMATVIKAVAEAAEDVRRAKLPGSVFDRLGRGVEVAAVDEDYGDFGHFQEELQTSYVERQQQSDDDMMIVMEREVELVSDYPSEYEQYDVVDIVTHDGVSPIDPIVEDDAFTLQHSIANNFDDTVNTVNAPGNVSAWKPPLQHRANREIPQKPLRRSTAPRAKSDLLQDMKENGGPVSIANGNPNAADFQKLQSNSGLSVLSMEDADLRTIFVNNVNTAATKDILSQYFNKFGEVVKVIINTDATTGQPIGSAVIEFNQKAAADSALSLDGTSFMSRILKVVKKSCAIQKPAAIVQWPRGRNPASSYARYPSRAPTFARGGGFRGRPPVRGGARSLQWKREGQAAPAEAAAAAASANSSAAPFPARRFTYVRTEPKPNNANATDAAA